MEDISQYDRIIQLAIWCAVGGIIMSGIGVAVFRQ